MVTTGGLAWARVRLLPTDHSNRFQDLEKIKCKREKSLEKRYSRISSGILEEKEKVVEDEYEETDDEEEEEEEKVEDEDEDEDEEGKRSERIAKRRKRRNSRKGESVLGRTRRRTRRTIKTQKGTAKTEKGRDLAPRRNGIPDTRSFEARRVLIVNDRSWSYL